MRGGSGGCPLATARRQSARLGSWIDMRRAVFAFRCAVRVVALLCAIVVFCNSLVAQETKRGKGDGSLKNASICYVGTYTNTPAKSKGIYLFKLQNSQTQEVSQNVMLAPLGVAAEAENPSY